MNIKQFDPWVSGHYSFAAAVSELKEIFEAKDMENLKEEIGDFIGCLFLWIGWWWLPLPSAFVKKIIKRRTAWVGIFENHGLEFKNEYLIGGSNYLKTEKVDKALDLAKKDQNKKAHN